MPSVLTEFLLIIILAALLLAVSAILSTGIKLTPEKYLVFDKAPLRYQLIFAAFAGLLLYLAVSSKLHEWAKPNSTIEANIFTFDGDGGKYRPSIMVVPSSKPGDVCYCTGHVSFIEKFSHAPIVSVSIAGFDTKAGDPVHYRRYTVTTDKIAPDGFDIQLRVWSADPPLSPVPTLSPVEVSWIAIEK